MFLPLYRPARMSQMLDRLYDENLLDHSSSAAGVPLDVFVSENDYTVNALVPGLKPEDLNIEINDNAITIRGETKPPVATDENGDCNCLMDEIRYGKFARTITIDSELDSSKAEAHVENGILTLRIPKAESAKPKVVKVMAR